MVPVADRAAVGAMLRGLGGTIDVIVPRGGKSLVARVQNEARVPVFAHLEGICHVYVDAAADLAMAEDDRRQRQDAPHRHLRRGRNAADRQRCRQRLHLKPLHRALSKPAARSAAMRVTLASPIAAEAGDRGGLGDGISRRDHLGDVVDGISRRDRAHRPHGPRTIPRRSSPRMPTAVERFFAEVDCAILLHNASTQFADGGEFGMGGEIGIATGKMHARGPVGVEQLTSFKYRVRGAGQVTALT